MSTMPADRRRPLIRLMPDGLLQAVLPDGRTVAPVRVMLAWPLRFRDRYIVVLDKESHEVFLAATFDDLDPACHGLVRQELDHRYLESRIVRVLSVRLFHKVSYWTVVTDRGPRRFMIEESDTNPERVTATCWRLVDSADNRYVIPDVTALDATSRRRLRRFLELPMV